MTDTFCINKTTALYSNMSREGLLSVLLILSFTGLVSGLKCFVCDSIKDVKCRDPFDNQTFPLVDGCAHCSRLTYTKGVSKEVRRDCFEGSMGSDMCMPTTITNGKDARQCFCSQVDGCNGLPEPSHPTPTSTTTTTKPKGGTEGIVVCSGLLASLLIFHVL
ncbi:hypothetical protein MAR_021848 [Mya arenaria]|uniref:Uncharacterized protein n=1 Tax=Mya arenaria TaxID=6604 RepID=A0ABY7EBC1_MYAAR|nr:uncharacterized protein LOC128235281 [Mya arenaria]WAR06479.1 hypothetical protein MAR_021848 [Mya arenaria]